ncbi:MAG: cytochrome C oxidase subunit IV [Candidatus Marinimicrobia bacterium]|jgi:cytochrome c oxidase subunit IV|nr:cytochrome C oxidase subunit IV [Candidatus Neomarinimicrobiota bacterium]MBT7472356.1 cytochrome C oxidase subunit IV [Candidatus Neomarinimicrobiota bacterium]MBT7580971.1 cytochrome C oxidase subunit IV [Candidatus Neomarinimicrobiota bacterium]
MIEEKFFKHPSFFPKTKPDKSHPIKLYLFAWLALFILSAMSYYVDYINLEGLIRWFLITILALMKAGLIVSVFMHLAWERVALIFTILLPPIFLILMLAIFANEGNAINVIRTTFN